MPTAADWYEIAERVKTAGPAGLKEAFAGQDEAILGSMGLPLEDWRLEWDGMPYAVSTADDTVRIRHVTHGFWSWGLLHGHAELSRGHSPYELREDAAALLSGVHNLSAYG